MSKDANRAAMPETAAIVDELREVFGKLPYGRFTENSITVQWGVPKVEGAAVPATATWKT